MMNARFLDLTEVPWDLLDRFGDRTVYQTREWMNFLAESQRARPVVAELRTGSEVAGYFTGLIVKRFGIRILGSPFPGWTTPYMGFNLVDGASRSEALDAVERLAFGELKCLHMEISDRRFALEVGEGLGFLPKIYDSYETDLRRSEAQIFGGMDSACRRCIRKAEKSGVIVQEAHDLEFADDYYDQLKHVFGNRGLVPPYGVERVRALIQHMLPTGRLLLVRALGPDGKCIATGIYPGFNKLAELWGNASYRPSQILRPNQALHWYAMRYWKARGVEFLDWGGKGTYKEKYGPYAISVPRFRKSRLRIVAIMRDRAKTAVRLKQVLLGRFSGQNTGTEHSHGDGPDDHWQERELDVHKA
jgi:hypothetical protein